MSRDIGHHAKFIQKKLRDCGINLDHAIIENELHSMTGINSKKVDENTIYENYLKYKARTVDLFKHVDQNNTIVYDMKLFTNDIPKKILQEQFSIKSYFYHKNVLYLKFTDDFFESKFSILSIKKITRYFNAYRIDEVYFNVKYDEQNILRLVMILKKIQLPLKILYYENNDDILFLHVENRNWPTQKEAIECVKSALLCHIYSHCKLSYGITRKALFLKFNNEVYKVVIIHEDRRLEDKKSDVNQNNDNKVLTSLKTYKSFHIGKKIAKRYIKLYLNAHGYFPFYINNYELDGLLEAMNSVNPGQLFVMFLKLKKEMLKNFLMLDTVLMDRLSKLNSKVLYYITHEVFINDDRLLRPSINDYDFVLSKKRYKTHSDKFITVSENDECKFVLGKIEVDDLFGLGSYAYLLYSEYNQILMVKMKNIKFLPLVINVLLVKTYFHYIYISKRNLDKLNSNQPIK